MLHPSITIDNLVIGQDAPPYVIAELSGNHNGDIERALALLDVAKLAGAHAVKLQTYTADTMTIRSDRPDFLIKGGLWDGYTLYDLYEKAHTPWAWHADLFNKAKELEITLFSAPFDESAVDFLETLDCPAYKIASFEAIDLPLIRHAASTGKPMILSTGMASLGEVEEAVGTAFDAGCAQLLLLHCVSGYPTPYEDANLRTIIDMQQRFPGCPIGLSDHTLGTSVAVAAVALGACALEKHITLDRNDGGPDAAFSLEPKELTQLVENTEQAWKALGTAHYDRKPSETANTIFRRSLYAVEDIPAGTPLTTQNVRRIRPGHGLPPKYYEIIIGRTAQHDIAKGTALRWDMIKKDELVPG